MRLKKSGFSLIREFGTVNDAVGHFEFNIMSAINQGILDCDTLLKEVSMSFNLSADTEKVQVLKDYKSHLIKLKAELEKRAEYTNRKLRS